MREGWAVVRDVLAGLAVAGSRCMEAKTDGMCKSLRGGQLLLMMACRSRDVGVLTWGGAEAGSCRVYGRAVVFWSSVAGSSACGRLVISRVGEENWQAMRCRWA